MLEHMIIILTLTKVITTNNHRMTRVHSQQELTKVTRNKYVYYYVNGIIRVRNRRTDNRMVNTKRSKKINNGR